MLFTHGKKKLKLRVYGLRLNPFLRPLPPFPRTSIPVPMRADLPRPVVQQDGSREPLDTPAVCFDVQAVHAGCMRWGRVSYSRVSL